MNVMNARMYSVNAATAAAWVTVLRWTIQRADVDADVIDYPAPRPLPALWARADLAGVFMCGHPFSLAQSKLIAVAAPVPSVAAYHDAPIYWTCIVARNDSGIGSLADTFSRRMAYTTPDSQSGYLALRALVAGNPHPFAAMVGPLVTPRRVVEAVLSGEADAGPVDSYALDLMRLHEPELVAPLHVVATTPPTPIPLLVASPSVPAAQIDRLRAALADVGDAPALADARAALLLRRFAAVEACAYEVLRQPVGEALI